MIAKNEKQGNQTFLSYNFFPKNHKGWIKIVEAFVAILLVMGVLLVVINQGNLEKKDISSKVYDAELLILREIQLNDALRRDILNSGAPPIEWANFPPSVKNKIIDRTPNYLTCVGEICAMDKICKLGVYPEKDVYAQSIAITTTLDTPEEQRLRQLKLFCWAK